VLAGLIISHPLLDFVLHMVITTLQQTIDEKISFLKEQINPNNKPDLNSTFQIQIDAIRSAANDLEYVEPLIKQKKELLKNSKDIKEMDRLLAELEALEWLQAQIVVFTLDNKEEAV
jgi:hypothetical protein